MSPRGSASVVIGPFRRLTSLYEVLEGRRVQIAVCSALLLFFLGAGIGLLAYYELRHPLTDFLQRLETLPSSPHDTKEW